MNFIQASLSCNFLYLTSAYPKKEVSLFFHNKAYMQILELLPSSLTIPNSV